MSLFCNALGGLSTDPRGWIEMLYETKFLISLGVTSVLEVPLAAVFVRYILRERGIRIWRTLVVAGFASFATLPYLWFVMRPFLDARTYLWTGEILVGVAEALIFWGILGLKWWKGIVLSAVVNSFSYFVGLEVLRWLF